MRRFWFSYRSTFLFFTAVFFFLGGSAVAPSLKTAPDIKAEKWFNTDEHKKLSMEELRDKVVLIFFWSVNDVNCQEDIPALNSLYAKYKTRGLEIIGVHSFEWAYDFSNASLADKIVSYGIEFPVASDDSLRTRTIYEQLTVPAYCLIDRQGFIRARYGGPIVMNAGLETMVEALLEQGRSHMYDDEV